MTISAVILDIFWKEIHKSGMSELDASMLLKISMMVVSWLNGMLSKKNIRAMLSATRGTLWIADSILMINVLSVSMYINL
jgi:hypothetical protein